jgi:hypothetical protein
LYHQSRLPRWFHRLAVADTEQKSQLEGTRLWQLHLPLRVPWTIQVQNDLESAIKTIVESSPSVYVNATLDQRREQTFSLLT